MQTYTASILAPEKNHTVRFDLTALNAAAAHRLAQAKGRALFQRHFSYTLRVAS